MCSHTFKASSQEVIVMRSEKMQVKGKIHKQGSVREFFLVNLQLGISQLHYESTSRQIKFRDFN